MSLGNYGVYVPGVDEYWSRSAHASSLIGDWVYIDGGELLYTIDRNISNGGLAQSSELPTTMQELLNKTLALDMRSDWVNSTVQYKIIDRGQAPLLNNAVLWPDAQSKALYKWAGSYSWWLIAYNFNQSIIEPPTLWKLTPDNAGGGDWSMEATSNNFPSSSPELGPQASGNGIGYYLGGQLDDTTYTSPLVPENVQYPISGLVTFNSTSGGWTNTTDTTIPFGGFQAYGGAQFVPIFGPVGLLVFFGTTPPTSDVFQSVESQTMETVHVYEPQSNQWYTQNVTGPSIPPWRSRFCTAGVAGDNGTYEIFIHGGTQASRSVNTTATAELQLDAVYILSLPSFTWYQAVYDPIASRYGHTCQVVGSGQRELLTIGGVSYNSSRDVFDQGLGIFDMTSLQWLGGYTAQSDQYETPSMIKDHLSASGPTPTVWADAALGSLFAQSRATTSSASPTSTHSHSHSSSAGAIAGGVVGGVVALLLLAGAFYLFRRRQRKQPASHTGGSKANAPGDDRQPAFASSEPHQESIPIHELGTREPQELFTTGTKWQSNERDKLLSEELEAQEKPVELSA